jgi:DNA-binding SARP family transcriptional activator
LTSFKPGEDCQIGLSQAERWNQWARTWSPGHSPLREAGSGRLGPWGVKMASRMALRLTLIEGFSLCRGTQEIGIPASGQRLIALLALKDRPVGRLHVAGTLWPEYSTERSLADLRTALWRVNQSGEHIISATPSLLRLEERIEIDVRNLVTFARLLTADANQSGLADLDMMSLPDLVGELLPDWYDDWLLDEREGLRQTRLHALERLARALSASGRHADAIQAALAAIRLEPLRETAHRTLIEIHLAEGNWSEAHRQFDRCRQLLQRELGVEPSDSMRHLLAEKSSRLVRLPALSAYGSGRLPGRPASDVAPILR